MRKECSVTQERLKELFNYNPSTGKLTRKITVNYNATAGSTVGSPHNDGYLAVQISGNKYLAHRIIWLYVTGAFPTEQLDHIDGNRVNNRISNLREATNQVNQQNSRLRKDNTTGLPGVRWYTQTNRWRADIVLNSKRHHLGYYKDFFEACCARKSAENKYGFHTNHGRAK